MLSRLWEFLKELWVPSSLEIDTRTQRLYRRVTVALAHGVVGAAAVTLLALMGVPTAAGAVLVLVLYIGKEAMDMSKAKDWKDCVEDTVAVAVGVIFAGSTLLPVALIVLSTVIVAFAK